MPSQTDDIPISTEAPTLDEVKKAVESLKSHKAAGEDDIPPEFWIHGGPKLIDELTLLLQRVWSREEIPKCWRMATVLPLHKKGDRADCKNYRGISLIDIAVKILEIILVERLKPSRERFTRDNQAGFRPGRGCIDQIFALRQVIESRREFNLNLDRGPK